ncbi:uncharacterized protein I206_105327 [Kwoniella pini CBS 10737]|uniref:Uncharacterized protein n=1 Tax=Kwoniella pini CBS 10737 TaxID=1296096 RepID=A0A1B9I4J9_9TREE|nr:uncharacterized protein I206_03763 [Kwoniella pini CBS 10737]OCF50441.1 hypothetical protein I206_03763 [Kwoniella pini CBS 10737]
MNIGNISEIMQGIIEPDPYLQYQPTFAYTLPIQLLVIGITFTLLCVLLIHLLFTTQYHYPLAPLNYILQLLSILTVLISVVIKIVVVLQHTAKSADIWPYDLDYVAVTIPPSNWNTGRCAAWFFLQALNNGLSNITHIQFLTMLYPSRTEARLIMFVLGPLAIASSALVFSALSPHQTVLDISDAIRNVFNSTLLLIFTISLVIWGFFVNRRRAWRFDGGTAVFGVGSLLLAAISTSFNFVAVAEDGIDWLQHLLFAAVLWQIWLGWWWWVGSGMGIGEVEDIMERAERKKRKAAKAAARARSAAAGGSSNGNRLRATSFSGIADNITSGVTSILKSSRVGSAGGTLTRRSTNRQNNDNHLAEEGAIELNEINNNSNDRSSPQGNGQQHVEFDQIAIGENEGSLSRGRNNTSGPGQTSTTSETSSTSATPSLHPPKTIGQFFSFPTTLLVIYLRKLRKAHEEAAKQQALDRAARRQKVFHESSPLGGNTPPINGAGGGGGGGGAVKDTTPIGSRGGSRRNSNAVRYERGIDNTGEDIGWGLGKFGIREHEESARRLKQAGERLNEDRLLPNASNPGEMENQNKPIQGQQEEEEVEKLNDNVNEPQEIDLGQIQIPTSTPRDEGEWEDIDSSNTSSEPNARRNGRGLRRNRFNRNNQGNNGNGNGNGNGNANSGSGWSWWGPLRDFRLNDRSNF